MVFLDANTRSGHRRPGEALIVLILLSGLLLAPTPTQAQTAKRNTAARFVQSGYERLGNRDYRAAADSFEESIRYDESNAAARLGLGTAYFHLHEDRLAERELKRALELSPRESIAYQVLGELYYRKDDLETAASYWEKAVELDPSNAALRSRLERIRREHNTEKNFNRDVTSHFLIKYEGREKIEAGRIVLRILEDAYGEVGRGLSFYPSREIQVILYSDRQFQEVTDAPGWSNGIYDGKIRIPIGGIERETPGLRRLLTHEYTHAAVRAIAPRVPTWLNEGLAQHFEGREIGTGQRELLRNIAASGSMPSLRQLDGPFTGYGGTQAAYAYLFSLSAVEHIIDRHGVYRIKMMLEELASGADTDRAVGNALIMSLEDLDRDWKRSLE